MRKTLWIVYAVIVSAVSGYGQTAPTQRALLDQYCVTCHNDRTKRANLSLEKLDLATHVGENPQFWEKVVRKLRAGVMPPPGMRRPDFTAYTGLTEWLETEIDRKAKTNPGTKVLHRLNRAEYANAIRDLLDIEIDPATLLPPDDSSRGFDNVAGSLGLSPTLLESYANAAGKIARMAVGYWKTPTERTYIAPIDTTQEYQIEGQPFGTRGGMVVSHVFPADGEYKFSLKEFILGPYIGDEQIELNINGERTQLFEWNNLKVGNPGADGDTGGGLEITVPVKAGTHNVAVTFVATNYRPSLDLAKHYARSTLENSRIAGFTNYPEVGLLKVQGPFNALRPVGSRSLSKVFTCRPSSVSQEEACAREIVTTQVRRMLADPRSEALVNNFAAQWLYLRNLKATSPVATSYPDWDDSLRQAFRRETELLFESVMREDRSVLDFLTADYTFVNDRLARQYGIPNVYGSQFRRVTLGPELDYRRGLLGKGSVLAITSVPDRNSPVKRGLWILDNILGTPPPEPPPNVPPLEDTTGEPGKILTVREKQTLHRKNEPCASCHKLFDPMGFALENFSADGSWRTKDGGDGGVPIDASVELYDGQQVNGPSGLRNALMRYSPQFVRMVTEKLMTYGLGRGVEYYDMPVIRSIARDASKNNYRFSSIVLGIVKSPPFQMRTKLDENAANE